MNARQQFLHHWLILGNSVFSLYAATCASLASTLRLSCLQRADRWWIEFLG